MVPVVTIEHGRTFAEFWISEDSIEEAFDATEIMTWPADEEAPETHEARDRYLDIADEILNHVGVLLREAIAAAFVKAANEVLDAKREARPTPPQPRLAFHQLFTVEGLPVFINPWQIVAMEDVPVANSGLGTHVTLANGSTYDFPIPYSRLYSIFLAAANGAEADT